MHSPPKVAIIVPTLNRPHTVVKCLRTIQTQTYEDWVCVVVNQGDPVEMPLIKGLRFIYVERRQKSASVARNIGLGIARALNATYVCLIDDDDWIEPTYMEEMVWHLDNDTATVLVACNGTYEGKTYAYDHPSTKLVGSRMVRASAIGGHTFAARSGQEKHFWRAFDGERQGQINKVLYHANRDPTGGLREDGGSY